MGASKAGMVLAMALAIFGTTNSAVFAQDEFVAGTTPDQRPANAPAIAAVEHDRAWYEHALTGVIPPYPNSLLFLDNQGNWYTPFTRPGMTGRYDVRGWHKPSS